MWAKFMAVGRLTRDPKEDLKFIKSAGEDVPVCNFAIAVDAETKEGETDFYDCVAWRKNAENLAKYMEKGKLVLVTGRPHIRSWEKDGVKHYRTEYQVDTIKFLERGKGAEAPTLTENNPPF